ncbi:hypothetical protein BDY19DRAFT_913690 [Irpex rosettiformis]|uniref:Uncharacterized protein n=1 Tax=Irpex rosettiformis TaxID=378272 RepID=A0ACB8UJP1_9APHY|nr:hypothetical protein BDY19DRAFT_913690 [Irpex rosettiformis]
MPAVVTPASKPRIVDDLIPIILESNGHWWPRDFQRLALVSASWVGPIRRRLYACPELRSFLACTLFARTISQNSHIRSLVHGINLRPASSERAALSEKDMASLRYILNLDRLDNLTIGGELAIQAERFLHMMSNTRSITSLHIDGSYLQQDDDSFDCKHPASLEWNDSIAFRFTRLRTLRLTNLQLALAEPSMPYVLHISSLIFHNVTIAFGSIQNLCNESWDSVRHLSIATRDTHASDDFVRELLECCENLETLRYEASCAGASGDLFGGEEIPVGSLRKLKFFDIDINPQTLVFLGQSCANLEYLSVLGRSVRLRAEDWIRFIGSGALPSLKVLRTAAGCYEPSSGFLRWSEDLREQLLSSCSTRSIDLCCSL